MKDSTGYYHVGYYIGCGRVLESNYARDEDGNIVDGCRIIKLEGTNYTECAFLYGINYAYTEEVVDGW